ncbi:hypothetical protein ENBRE01_2011, partial [Enteropsectra breve]
SKNTESKNTDSNIADRITIRNILKTKGLVKIKCNKNDHSICALAILVHIFKKRLINYEIAFECMPAGHSISLDADSSTHIISDRAKYPCTCKQKQIISTTLLFHIAKDLNMLSSETIWPMAVVYSYYREFINMDYSSEVPKNDNGNVENRNNIKYNQIDNEDDRKRDNRKYKTDVCGYCRDLKDEIVTAVKFINKNDIFYQKSINLIFSDQMSIFNSVKNTLGMIYKMKMVHNRKVVDKRINEFMAWHGISIETAGESYRAMGGRERSTVEKTFGTSEEFVFRIGHSGGLGAVEQMFLLNFYLYKGKNELAFMSLFKKKLMDGEKASRFYQKIIAMLKDGMHAHKQSGDVVLFKIKDGGASPRQGNEYRIALRILNGLFRQYLKYRYGMKKYSLICIEGGVHFVYSTDFDLESGRLVASRNVENYRVMENLELKGLMRTILGDS